MKKATSTTLLLIAGILTLAVIFPVTVIATLFSDIAFISAHPTPILKFTFATGLLLLMLGIFKSNYTAIKKTALSSPAFF